MAADHHNARQRGFTLIEAIMVIVIVGIVAAMIASFIRAPIDAYADTVRRGQLTDTADTALRRIARELRTALPNSVRQPTGSNACVEFLPTVAGGRYRADQDSSGVTKDILDFTLADSSFEALAQNGTISAGQRLVIYNLGIPASGTSLGSDAYGGDNTAVISGEAGSIVSFTAAKQFPFVSPGKRFQVIPNTSTVFAWNSASLQLVRFTQAIAAAAPVACPTIPAAYAVLAENVSGAAFNYAPGVTQRSGLLTLQIALSKGGETVTLVHEIHVDNVP